MSLPTGIDRLPSGKYRARYRDADGRMHSRTFPTVREARTWRTAQVATVYTGVHVDSRDGRVSVSAYARELAAAKSYRVESSANVVSGINTALAGHRLGQMRLGDVHTVDVQGWVKDGEARYAPATFRKHFEWLKYVFAVAVDDRRIPTTPFTLRVKRRKATQAQIAPLTVDQVRDLAGAVPDRYSALVILAAGTGLRLGEVLGLSVSDVDFLRREVHVRVQLRRDSTVLAEPKTDRSRRTVPLPAHAADAVAAHLAHYGPGPDGLLWSSERGTVLSHQVVQDKVQRAVQATPSLPAGTTIRDCRHHFASVLIDKGVDVFKVAAALGHSTPRLVLQTYGHLVPDSEDRIRSAVDSAWNVTPVSQQTVTRFQQASDMH